MERCAIVTFEAFSKAGISSRQVLEALALRKIAVSVSPSYHSFDDNDWARHPAVRISPSYFNTEDEVDTVVAAIREIIGST